MKTILLLSVDELYRKNPCLMCLPHKGPRKQDASVILKESHLEFFLQPPLSDYYLQAFSINLAKLKESNIRLQVWFAILNKSNKGLVNIININLTNEYDLLLFLKSRGLLDPRIRMCIIYIYDAHPDRRLHVWCMYLLDALMMHDMILIHACMHDADGISWRMDQLTRRF